MGPAWDYISHVMQAYDRYTMSSASNVVVVTGGCCFTGYETITQLLDSGYRVRAIACGKYVNLLQKALSDHHRPKTFEVVEIHDISTDDLTAVLDGVYGVIHVAIPSPGHSQFSNHAPLTCTMRIAHEVFRAGIRRLVIASSIFAYPCDGPWGPDDYKQICEDKVARREPIECYTAQKALLDQALIKFSDQTLVDVSLVAAGTTFGPFAPGFELMLPEPDYRRLSTNCYIHALLRPYNTSYPHPMQKGSIDVRDLSRAFIMALESSPNENRKRFPMVSPEQCSYRAAVEIIAAKRPRLSRKRLCDPDTAPNWPSYTLDVDRNYIEQVVGFPEDSYTPWQKTVLDTVDSLIVIEDWWKAQGFHVVVPDPMS